MSRAGKVNKPGGEDVPVEVGRDPTVSAWNDSAQIAKCSSPLDCCEEGMVRRILKSDAMAKPHGAVGVDLTSPAR